MLFGIEETSWVAMKSVHLMHSKAENITTEGAEYLH